ncbi:hypothetical protein, partial [Klebsiella michiganensis]|uniref:hypothetical protein n=1 Tax=Klebsiella michiganensis TaxID=1134687 RepID=UPI00292D67C2
LTTLPEPTEVWCWFISAVLWGSLSANAAFFMQKNPEPNRSDISAANAATQLFGDEKKDAFQRLSSGNWYRGWDSNPQAR